MIALKKSVLNWKINEKDCKVQGVPTNLVEKNYVLGILKFKLYSTS